jgi:dTDP-4-amino-4,6-dideoxygalactose transaminase
LALIARSVPDEAKPTIQHRLSKKAMQQPISRRSVSKMMVSAVAAAQSATHANAGIDDSLPAQLGGKPVRARGTGWTHWPIIGENDLQMITNVLKSGLWNRLSGPVTPKFEAEWARRMQASHCLATANGTSALITALAAMDIGPGDEVIVPPYTFAATVNAVLLHHALPVFSDTDIETFQIDCKSIESLITPATAVLMPVHLGGSVADMDAIGKIAAEKKLKVIEDACQSPLAEWRSKPVSAIGDMGCFSFQASKNLNAGEGGAILTNNKELFEEARSFHNNGRAKPGSGVSGYGRNGANLRLTEFQSAILLAQMERLDKQAKTRETNAAYLSDQLRQIPGISPAKMYEGTTRNAYHLYMFRYNSEAFGGLSRDGFLKALSAEGIPASTGYGPLNKEHFLKVVKSNRGFLRIYGEKHLNDWYERNSHRPANDRLCGEGVWLTQNMLLGPKSDMDQIAEAVRKIQKHAGALVKA